MIVTIDGPAGAGKSSVARQVAERLGFEFLDTGAMYRAVTLGALRAGVALEEPAAVDQYTSTVRLDWYDNRIFLDGDDVTGEVRTPEVTAAIRYVADVPAVRQRLSQQQRRIAAGRDVVTEGRDQGSEVFPDAECKIFLTASAAQRARRRHHQLAESGQHVPFEEILAAQNKRDEEDEGRPVGGLRCAEDAVVIHSDAMSPQQVVDRAIEIVRQAMARLDRS